MTGLVHTLSATLYSCPPGGLPTLAVVPANSSSVNNLAHGQIMVFRRNFVEQSVQYKNRKISLVLSTKVGWSGNPE